MMRAEALDRPDAEQAAVAPDAEEGDRRIEQFLRIEREAVLGRGLGERELQVPCQQRPHVRLARVLHGNLPVSHHAGTVRDRYFSAVNHHTRPGLSSQVLAPCAGTGTGTGTATSMYNSDDPTSDQQEYTP